ncbi:MAG TPA: DUF2332 domain-containing protein, partial [Caulobacteraceae bacterium]|nr:DUF2332 domain-containing protein [Caulobacteraceae bacterium]
MDIPADTADPVVQGLKLQAKACEAMGSAFSGHILERAAEAAASPGPLRALFAQWEGVSLRGQIDDAVALRFLGALHDLALGGEAPDLTAAYPGDGRAGDPELAWRAAETLVRERPAFFKGFMAHEPQTNETRRSIALIGGFLTVAAVTGLPLRLFELGASAGLNQAWDRFHYEAAGQAWGDPASPVRLDTDWRGGPPPFATPAAVVERAACDRKPV